MCYKRFRAMCSEGKPVTGPMIVDIVDTVDTVNIVKSLYDEIKITNICTFSVGWLKSNKKKGAYKKLGQYKYCVF
jgi:hypothetical protein